jgi:CheY-like chemotaxis protein
MTAAEPALRLRVLVVEDCPDNRESLCLILRLWGHDVREAADGGTALQTAAAFRPQVVLLDIGLPDRDGYQVARELRRLPGAAGAVLVAVTAYGQERDKEQARAAGFDHHLLKPCDMELLEQVLTRPCGVAGAAAAGGYAAPCQP